jgi:hypothetical protein
VLVQRLTCTLFDGEHCEVSALTKPEIGQSLVNFRGAVEAVTILGRPCKARFYGMVEHAEKRVKPTGKAAREPFGRGHRGGMN